MASQPDDIRGTLERYLETDRLLGARSAPLRPPSPPAPQRPAGSQASAAPRAATPPAPGGPVIRSQQISDAERAEREKALQALDAASLRAALPQFLGSHVDGEEAAARCTACIGQIVADWSPDALDALLLHLRTSPVL